MATLVARIGDLATRIAAEFKAQQPRLLPAGGTAGQVLSKGSGSSYDVGWASVASGSATPGWSVEATGTGASQTISLPEAVLAAGLLVFVNGLRQTPATDYTVTASTLSLTAPGGAAISVVKPAGNPGAAGIDGDDAIGISDAPSDGKTYGRKNGSWSEATSTSAGVVAKPKPPWIRRTVSDWKTVTNASGAITAGSLRLVPFTLAGADITAVDFFVQGSVSAGTTIFLGLYAADDVTGLPGAKLWDNGAGTSVTAAGAMTVAVSGLTAPPRMVWLATYISAGSSTQFVTGASSGEAERTFGLTTGMSLNASVVALLATNTWAGAMPDPITYSTSTPFTSSGNVILPFLRTSAPA